MQAVTKPQLRAFCRFCIDKGLMNRNTGLGSVTAVDSLLEQYTDTDDVSNVSVSMEGIQFNNRHPGKMAPGSLMTYQSRLTKVLAEYQKYVGNPSGYKPPSKSTRAQPKARPASPVAVPAAPSQTALPVVASTTAPQTAAPMTQAASLATEHALALPFPLRPSFLAQVVIPRDLTRDEANRLCAFIQALGQSSTVEVQQ